MKHQQFVVTRGHGAWRINCGLRHIGEFTTLPYALQAAVEEAHRAASDSCEASVVAIDAMGRSLEVWTAGTDPYPTGLA